MVLGHMRPLLDEGETVIAWAHMHTPEDGRHGIVAITASRCFVNWTPRNLEDTATAWDKVTGWTVHDSAGGPVLTLATRDGSVAFRLPISSKVRARKASALLRAVAERAPAAAGQPELRGLGPSLNVRPSRRGLRGHTKRAVITVIGLLVIVVGLLFASPFVPGPGILTILAGLAILASEYDWAKDTHHWLRRTADELLERFRAWRRRRSERLEG